MRVWRFWGLTQRLEELPPLSCGPIEVSAAVAIDESESELGQVLIIGGLDEAAVHKVDLATGMCTPQPLLLSHHGPLHGFVAAACQTGASFASGGTAITARMEWRRCWSRPDSERRRVRIVGSGGICLPLVFREALAEGAC
jgi:hypothetical protein